MPSPWTRLDTENALENFVEFNTAAVLDTNVGRASERERVEPLCAKARLEVAKALRAQRRADIVNVVKVRENKEEKKKGR